MRPRWHFVARGVFMMFGTALLALALLYIVSFIFLVLRLSGVWFAPSFGLKGWFVFILFVAVAVNFSGAPLLCSCLSLQAEKFALVYRRPLLYSVSASCFWVLSADLCLNVCIFMIGSFSQARDNGLPIGGMLYRDFGMRHSVMYMKVKLLVYQRSAYHRRAKRQPISFDLVIKREVIPYHMMAFTTTTFSLSSGDNVVIFGPEDDCVIQALGSNKNRTTALPSPLSAYAERFLGMHEIIVSACL